MTLAIRLPSQVRVYIVTDRVSRECKAIGSVRPSVWPLVSTLSFELTELLTKVKGSGWYWHWVPTDGRDSTFFILTSSAARYSSHSMTPTPTPTPIRPTRLHPYVRHARFPREDPRKDVGVGVVECELNAAAAKSSARGRDNAVARSVWRRSSIEYSFSSSYWRQTDRERKREREGTQVRYSDRPYWQRAPWKPRGHWHSWA